MTERTDQFDERDQLEGIEPPVGDEAAEPTDGLAEQGPDAFGAPEGGEPT
jgi:hypothetical protein